MKSEEVTSSDMINRIPAKIRTELRATLAPGEILRAWVQGNFKQTMALTDFRIIVVKQGMMAGSTFGSQTTSYTLDQISAVEHQRRLGTSMLVVRGPGIDANRIQSVSGGKEKDAYEVPNAIPINDDKAAAAFVREVMALKSRQASNIDRRSKVETPESASLGFAGELERLVALKAAGHIDDDEFQKMKAKLIEG
jgi:hypothetical protein